MYQPWVAHNYPGLEPQTMVDLSWSMYVAMWDGLKD